MAVQGLVARRYLWTRQPGERFISASAGLSLLGIALGVAALIVVMAVMNGFHRVLLSQVLGVNGHVTVVPYQGQADAMGPLAGELTRLPEVAAVMPVVEGQAMAIGPDGASGAMVRGVVPADLRARPLLADAVTAGSLDAFAGNDAVVLGGRLAEALGVSAGDEVRLVAPEAHVGPFGAVPRVKTYTVAALFTVDMYQYDSSFAFVPLPAAQVFFRKGDGISYLEVFLDDPARAPALAGALQQVVGARARVVTWQETSGGFFRSLAVERNVMFVILTLIVLVAALNIVSSLVMLVRTKRRDIAILRTMGASRGQVLRIFLMTGGTIGLTGTLAGVALGVVFARNIESIRRGLESLLEVDLFAAEIYYLSRLPADIVWSEVALVAGLALGLSFLATLLPAWRAARLDPVEALRHE